MGLPHGVACKSSGTQDTFSAKHSAVATSAQNQQQGRCMYTTPTQRGAQDSCATLRQDECRHEQHMATPWEWRCEGAWGRERGGEGSDARTHAGHAHSLKHTTAAQL